MPQPCRPETWTFQCDVSLRTAGTLRELVDAVALCCSVFSESEDERLEEQAHGRRSLVAQNPDQVCLSRVCDGTLAAVAGQEQGGRWLWHVPASYFFWPLQEVFSRGFVIASPSCYSRYLFVSQLAGWLGSLSMNHEEDYEGSCMCLSSPLLFLFVPRSLYSCWAALSSSSFVEPENEVQRVAGLAQRSEVFLVHCAGALMPQLHCLYCGTCAPKLCANLRT